MAEIVQNLREAAEISRAHKFAEIPAICGARAERAETEIFTSAKLRKPPSNELKTKFSFLRGGRKTKFSFSMKPRRAERADGNENFCFARICGAA